jgi:hypothetical protein
VGRAPKPHTAHSDLIGGIFSAGIYFSPSRRQGHYISINVQNDVCLLQFFCYNQDNPLRTGMESSLLKKDVKKDSMALKNYGILKGRPIDRRLGFGASPHHQVHLIDDDDNRITVNVKSKSI